MMTNLKIRALAHAVLVLVYVTGVVWFMSNASRFLGEEDKFTTPLLALMLFVLSAAIVGALVLGKPIIMYLGGLKSEAIRLFAYTLGWMFVITVILFLINL